MAALAIALAGSTACRRHTSHEELGDGGPTTTATAVSIAYAATPSFSVLAHRLAPSVVQLHAEGPVQHGPGDWFAAATALAPVGKWADRMQSALGSGVIVDYEGSVVTNAHLLGDRSVVGVTLHDGVTCNATVVGRDQRTDLAVLRLDGIDREGLKPARWGQSEELRVGEWVFSLANPFGLGPLLSAGIVSARYGDTLPLGEHGRWGYLQTELRVHAATSGAPVFNGVGELVGLATATQAEQTDVGFVLPSSTIRRLLPALLRHGEVRRAWIGMYIDRLTAEMARRAGLRRQDAGAIVTSVVHEGPAEQAGLRAGDVIVRFDGKAIQNATELPWLSALAGIGRVVMIEVSRQGQHVTIPVRTEPMPH